MSLPEDLRVSKVHCAIIRSGDKLYLRDEGSKNHTYLNGKQIHKPIVIQKEDVITVGETRLEVVKICGRQDNPAEFFCNSLFNMLK